MKLSLAATVSAFAAACWPSLTMKMSASSALMMMH